MDKPGIFPRAWAQAFFSVEKFQSLSTSFLLSQKNSEIEHKLSWKIYEPEHNFFAPFKYFQVWAQAFEESKKNRAQAQASAQNKSHLWAWALIVSQANQQKVFVTPCIFLARPSPFDKCHKISYIAKVPYTYHSPYPCSCQRSICTVPFFFILSWYFHSWVNLFLQL